MKFFAILRDSLREALDAKVIYFLFGLSALAALVNAPLGILLAWTLTRYEFPGRRILDALVDLPFVALFIVIVWVMGGPVALVPAIAVPVVMIVGLVLQLPLNEVVWRTLEEGARKHAVLVETINGLETVKSVGAEGRMQRAWERST